MSKTQKILLTIALAVILVFAYTVNVSAANTYYNFSDFVNDNDTTTITLELEDTLYVTGTDMDKNLVGDIIELNSGTITIKKEMVGSNLNLTITLNDNSVATVKEEEVANLDNDSINELEIIIGDNATLNIEGTLVIPSMNRTNSITNKGTINIEEGGALEIRKEVTYDADAGEKIGIINVSGTLAIFGEKITALGYVCLYESGKIYSYTNIKEYVRFEQTNYSLKSEEDTTYTSNAPTGGEPVTLSNAYFYELTEAESDVGTDDTNSTTGDNVTTDDNGGEVTETVEETTETVEEATETEDETTETVEEATETEDETTSNPETGDSIMVFAVVFVVAIAGIVVTIKMRKRIK